MKTFLVEAHVRGMVVASEIDDRQRAIRMAARTQRVHKCKRVTVYDPEGKEIYRATPGSVWHPRA